MSSNVVIAGYARTPFTFAHKGELARTRPDELAAAAVRGLLARTGVKPEDIEDLICGCAMPEGEQGLNVGRLVALMSGLPITVAGATINRFCGSSMNAIHMAAGSIVMGAGEVFVCAGVESMTRVPVGGYNPMPNPALVEAMPGAYMAMGETAENLVEKYQVTRDEQEELAISSHAKAAAAQAEGRLTDE
ncbi:MAG: acetyl-CoA C-acyltransferase, partial [Paracoccaceae bacterium]|nr:acetyl-CoA C-acyltransferase [Paracoccaceae bacterium]